MSAFTLVYRALPFSLPWKRRPSTSVTSNKGKEKEAEVQLEESDYISPPKIQHCLPNVEIPDLPAHRDISHDLHIAVKQRLDQKTTRNDAQSDDSEAGYASDSDSDSHSDCKTHHLAEKCEISARPRLARVVSWASIVRSQCRWTSDQEKKLEDAERQLARCQKAWSSEQELWLAYVCFYFFLSGYMESGCGSSLRMIIIISITLFQPVPNIYFHKGTSSQR